MPSIMNEVKKSIPQNGAQWLVAVLSSVALMTATGLGTWAISSAQSHEVTLASVQERMANVEDHASTAETDRRELRQQMSALTNAVTQLTTVVTQLQAEVERLRGRGGGQ